MRRRSPVPHLILGILTVLALGAVALGLVLAPTTADLTARNGAGEVQLAGNVTAVIAQPNSPLLRAVYVAPDFGRLSTLKGARSRTLPANEAKTLLAPVGRVLQVTSFTEVRPSVYVGTVPLDKLFSPAEVASIHGTFTVTATVSNGYVVRVVERPNLRSGAQRTTSTLTYRITTVNGWRVTPA
jgi:hypothetical protein